MELVLVLNWTGSHRCYRYLGSAYREQDECEGILPRWINESEGIVVDVAVAVQGPGVQLIGDDGVRPAEAS